MAKNITTVCHVYEHERCIDPDCECDCHASGCWMVENGWQIYFDENADLSSIGACDDFEHAKSIAISYWREQAARANGMILALEARIEADYAGMNAPDDENY